MGFYHPTAFIMFFAVNRKFRIVDAIFFIAILCYKSSVRFLASGRLPLASGLWPLVTGSWNPARTIEQQKSHISVNRKHQF
jgi:hypothetical protein